MANHGKERLTRTSCEPTGGTANISPERVSLAGAAPLPLLLAPLQELAEQRLTLGIGQ
jgi:hypothetical protein